MMNTAHASPPDPRTFARQVLQALQGGGLSHVEAHVFEVLVPENLVPLVSDFLADVDAIGLTSDDFESLPMFCVAAIVDAIQQPTSDAREFRSALTFQLTILVSQVRRAKKFQRARDQALRVPHGMARPAVDFNVRELERTLTQRHMDVPWKEPNLGPRADRPYLETDDRKDHHLKSGNASLRQQSHYLQGEDRQARVDALTRIAGYHATDLFAQKD